MLSKHVLSDLMTSLVTMRISVNFGLYCDEQLCSEASYKHLFSSLDQLRTYLGQILEAKFLFQRISFQLRSTAADQQAPSLPPLPCLSPRWFRLRFTHRPQGLTACQLEGLSPVHNTWQK